jgi:excisionase family DNA binding protein
MFPADAELTIEQAADYLDAPPSHIVDLIEAGSLKYREVGTERRICFDDLRSYKQQKHQSREAALDELAAEAQRLRLGY